VNPFRISCATCHARLKIVDPAAVGQILACPKCGSFVQAAPPPDWSPDEPASSNSGLGSSLVVPLLGSRPETAAVKQLPAATAKQCDAATKPRAEPPPLPTEAAAATASTARWFWPALSAATVLSIAVAALLIYLDRKNHAAQVASSDPASQQIAPAVPNPIDGVKTPESKPTVTNQADVASPAKPVEKSTDKPASVAAAPSNPTPTTSPSAPADGNPAAKANDSADAAVKPASDAKPEPTAPTVTAEKPSIPPDSNPAPAKPEPSPLPAHPAPADPPPAQIARPSVERVPPKDVDVQAHLAARVAGVDYKGVPLVRLLTELTQWTTIPITLDADALHEMNIAADVPVTVTVKDTTVGGVLDEVLQPLKLSYSIVGHQLLIGRPPTDELRRVRYNVSDLAGDSPEGMTQFAALVHAMIEPTSWKEARGAGTSRWSDGALVIEQNESAHAQMIVFCEKLRLARGLPLRSKLDPDIFNLEPRTAAAKATLSKSVTLNFGRPEPLASVLAYLHNSTQAIFLVDQIALAQQQTSVAANGILVADRQPLGQALTTLLEPMDMTWRVVDGRTIEITTNQAAARHCDVEFYRVAELLAGDPAGQQLIARIERELASTIAADPSIPAAKIHFDAPSRSLIVRAPQDVQLRVAALLSGWRVARQ
jgi:hypothetical protein